MSFHVRILLVGLASTWLPGCSSSSNGDRLTVPVGGDVVMELVRIRPGRMLMGSPASEQEQIRLATKPSDDWLAQEKRHEVEITTPFYMGVYEVTQGQYEKIMRFNPSYFCAAGQGKASVAGRDTSWFPVDSVTWEDALEFCKRLSEKEGKNFDLPTEAEWEYACRAGTTGPFNCGGSLGPSQANFFGGTVEQAPALVGMYPPNEFGLFDMHGNVAEWCKDWYARDYFATSPRNDPTGPRTGSKRVLRGGSWCHASSLCRSAARGCENPEKRENSFGFRVVMRP